MRTLALLYLLPAFYLGVFAWTQNLDEPIWKRSICFVYFGLIWPLFIPIVVDAVIRQARKK